MIADYRIEDFLGEGWFPIETDGIKRWAWSKEEAFLNFPVQHRGFSLEFSGCPALSSDLIAYHKEKEIHSYRLTNSLATINIPSGITLCKIKLENSWIPKEVLGTVDERPLGICLHDISPIKLYLETCDWFPHTIEMGLTGICNINPPCVMCVTRNSRNRV